MMYILIIQSRFFFPEYKSQVNNALELLISRLVLRPSPMVLQTVINQNNGTLLIFSLHKCVTCFPKQSTKSTAVDAFKT